MARAIKDLTGRRFGRLVAIRCVGRQRKRSLWLCTCDCGNTKTVNSNALLCGTRRSCDCWRKEWGVARGRLNTKHGQSQSPTYKSWRAMLNRCTNPKSEQWNDYGARGIKVCERWAKDYRNFFADMGERPRGKTIDRIDTNGNYEPGNCRWSTVVEQNRNSRNNQRLSFNGETLCTTEWALRIGAAPGTITRRLNSGWPIELALTVPPSKKNKHYGKRP